MAKDITRLVRKVVEPKSCTSSEFIMFKIDTGVNNVDIYAGSKR